MAVADEAEGWAEAQRRIAVCRETRADTLDLGGLRLTRVPGELYELGWLRRLYLGADAEAREQPYFNGYSEEGKKRCNALSALPPALCEALVRVELLDLAYNGLPGLPKEVAALVNLTSLNLWGNQVGTDGARALAGLVNLTSLDLGGNEIGADGARALAGLVNLTSLDLVANQIDADGARALADLVNLTSLDLGGNEIGADGAQALAGLVNLTSLDLSRTEVKDLSPLLKLGKLRKLDCSGCQLDDAIPALWMMPSLSEAILYEATLPGVPIEVLSPSPITSCLQTLRAHFNDLAAGEAEMADVKFMILGNGRVGKTQLCRRLRGEPYDESVPSTHGIEISSAPLARARGETPLATLRIWDFGGQDIYHGTHALFLKSRAIFPLVWTPDSEVTQFHDHGGFTFRNQPLGYWLAYVRSLGGRNSPVLVIQAQCDRPEDERASLPLPPGALDAFPFQKPLRFSAKTDRGRASLDEALADAVTWLRRNQGVDKIGKGRAEVKARLEAMRDDDAGRPPAERRHRLVTQVEFLDLCEKAGNISSPGALLDYLHSCGTVFYRRGLFGDRIILDQAWALDAVYAVFDRGKSYRNLQRYRGRFTRSDLGQWVWDAEGHGIEEQNLFLSLMQQCGICFRLRRGDDRGLEAEYIAPDLLPGREDPETAAELQQKWEERCDAHATLTYELLPPGLMRAQAGAFGRQGVLRVLRLGRRPQRRGAPARGRRRSPVRAGERQRHRHHPRQDGDALRRPHLQVHDPARPRQPGVHHPERQIPEIRLLHARAVRGVAQLPGGRCRVHRPHARLCAGLC